MQTFLPYENFEQTARCLDYRRLGKQRVEARQIWNILTGNAKSNAWAHHPAVLMWKGFDKALAMYHNVIIEEWIKRGYNNNMTFIDIEQNVQLPKWIGNEMFHRSHQSNLLRKDFNYYSQFNWDISDNLEYVWPKEEK